MKRGAPAAAPQPVPPAPSAPAVEPLIAEALAIIDRWVKVVVPGGLVVDGAGADGPVMGAARALEQAVALTPSPQLHYAYCSALAIAAQFQTARAQLEALGRAHPGFALGRWALAAGDQWKPLFALPPWGASTTAVNARISKELISCTLLPVRDGITPRAALFLRDKDGIFQDLAALRAARIDITAVVDQETGPTPVVGVYALVWDDPANSMNLEAHGLPQAERGGSMRQTYEYLCHQSDIDFVVIDQADRIKLNRRLPLPDRMKRELQKLKGVLDGKEASAYPPAALRAAIQRHQARFEATKVAY